MIIINNGALGMITQFQHLYFDNRMFGTTEAGGFKNPDFVSLAKSYGINCINISENDLDSMDHLPGPPILINYKVDGLTTVSPKLEYNEPIYNPTPQLQDENFYRLYNEMPT